MGGGEGLLLTRNSNPSDLIRKGSGTEHLGAVRGGKKKNSEARFRRQRRSPRRSRNVDAGRGFAEQGGGPEVFRGKRGGGDWEGGFQRDKHGAGG